MLEFREELAVQGQTSKKYTRPTRSSLQRNIGLHARPYVQALGRRALSNLYITNPNPNLPPALYSSIIDIQALFPLVYLAVNNLLNFLVLISIYIDQFQYRRFPSKGVRSLLQFIELYNQYNRVYSLSQQEVQLISQIVHLIYYLERSSILQ